MSFLDSKSSLSSRSSSCSLYSFDFSSATESWVDFYRSNPSTSPSIPGVDGSMPVSSTFDHEVSQNAAKNSSPDSGGSHPRNQYSGRASPRSTRSSPWYEDSPPYTSSSPAALALSMAPSHLIKEEEPDSPRIIIEPLLPSSHVVKRSTSSSPEPFSPLTQAELETQLLLSQALAPPTEVPLRATQACDEMRQMMRSFRLNPFSILTSNGKDLKSENQECSILTWCGEIPRPLDEEPLIFEWQLEGYNNGLADELSGLVAFHDDGKKCPDVSFDDVPGNLEDSAAWEEVPESLTIFSSSEAASNSGLSNAAESGNCHPEPNATLPMIPKTSFAPRGTMEVNNDTKQRAGSYDSGYESNNTPPTHESHVVDDSLFHVPYAFDGHEEIRSPPYSLPGYKKPGLDLSQSFFPNSTGPRNEQEIVLCSASSPHSSDVSLSSVRYALRKAGSEGKLSSSHPKFTSASFVHDPNRRGSSYGSMYFSTLLSAEPSNTLSSIDHPKLSRLPPNPPSSTGDVMNVAKIWECATNPEKNLYETEPKAELHPQDTWRPRLRTSASELRNMNFGRAYLPSQPYPSSTSSFSRLIPHIEPQGPSSPLSLLHTQPAISRHLPSTKIETQLPQSYLTAVRHSTMSQRMPYLYNNQHQHQHQHQQPSVHERRETQPLFSLPIEASGAIRPRSFPLNINDGNGVPPSTFEHDVYAAPGMERYTPSMGYP